MASSYPTSLDALTNPAGTQTQDNPTGGHSQQHSDTNDAIENIETTLGTTAGTSVIQHFAAGQFAVRHTGVAATGTLVQTLVGGTFNSATLGTATLQSPTITLSSDATGDLFYRSAGGTVARLAIGNAGQALVVSGGLPAWGAPGAISETVGTQISTLATVTASGLVAMTNTSAALALSANSRIMGNFSCAMGHSTADKRIGVAFTLNGTIQPGTFYQNISLVDVNANSQTFHAHVYTGTQGAITGTIGVQWENTDAAGSAYVGFRQLTLMEVTA